jgi:hypothetical protein
MVLPGTLIPPVRKSAYGWGTRPCGSDGVAGGDKMAAQVIRAGKVRSATA